MTNSTVRNSVADVVGAVQVLELAATDSFDKLFIRCLNF